MRARSRTTSGYVLVTYMMTLFFLLGPYAAMLFLQAECFDSELPRHRFARSSPRWASPARSSARFVLTALIAAAVPYSTGRAVIVGAGGMVISRS